MIRAALMYGALAVHAAFTALCAWRVAAYDAEIPLHLRAIFVACVATHWLVLFALGYMIARNLRRRRSTVAYSDLQLLNAHGFYPPNRRRAA